MKMACHY